MGGVSRDPTTQQILNVRSLQFAFQVDFAVAEGTREDLALTFKDFPFRYSPLALSIVLCSRQFLYGCATQQHEWRV